MKIGHIAIVTLLILFVQMADGASLTWDVNTSDAVATDGSGTWDAVNTNWWNGTANTNWNSVNPDTATFGAANGAAGIVTVSGTQTVAGITFNLPGSGTYMIAGGTLVLSNNPTITANTNAAIGSILAGTGSLTKSGSGTLTLTNSNTYTGGTTVNNGTLAITTTASALSGAIDINSGGTLALKAGGVTYTNNISGAGTVVVTTIGNTFLTGDHHLFTGILDITNGGGNKLVYGTSSTTQGQLISSSATIKVEAGDTLFAEQGSGNTLNFGSSLQLYGMGNSENFGALRIDKSGATWSGPVTLFGNSSIGNFSSGSTMTISGTIGESGGSFGLTKQGNGSILLTGTNTYSGATILSAGQLILANSLAITNSTVTINLVQGLAFATATNFTVGGLSGNMGLTLTNLSGKAVLLSVGNNNADTIYGGVLSGPGSLVKIGTGTLTLSVVNTYTGPTIINGGTLRLPSVTITNLPSNLQIWPVGDSITYGSFGSNGGYRGFLYNLLLGNTTNSLFVGSSVQNGGITTLPSTQWHNEGHESYAINNIYTNLDGFDNSLFLQYGGASRDPNGGAWLTGTNARPALFPTITLLLIGANERDNPTGAQGRLDNLVSKLVTMRPTNQLFIARITPIIDSLAHSNFVVGYNQGVDAVVTKYAVSNLVSEVDLNTGFPANGLSSDNLHPNDTGYSWMANQWYKAILSVMPTSVTSSNANISTNTLTVAAGSTFDLGSSPVVISALSGGGSVKLSAGGTLTINNPGSSAFSGAISGAGSLTKNGGGTLTLNGTNTYSGSTMVGAGELVVMPSFDGKSNVIVATNAAFGITNSVAASAGLSNITVNAGATLEFLGVSSLTTPLATASNLLVNGTCTIKITGTNGLAAGHSYPLINYTGGFSGNFTNLQLQIAAGWSCLLVNNSQQIALNVAGLPATPTNLTATAGDGQASLNWASASGATSYNVKRLLTSGSGYVTATNVTGTSVVNTGLANGELNYFVVSATNSAGESGNSGEVSVRPVSFTPPQIGIAVGANQLQLFWPADHVGWFLQAQTNSLATGLGTNWFTVPGSAETNQMLTPVSMANGSVFYRLIYP